MIDVDFSLAIHNRTGKYFIGRDLLATRDLPIDKVRYWYLACRTPPSGLFGRIVGRLQHLHIRGQTLGGPFGQLPRRQSPRPLLHLDPFTVPTTMLRRQDAILCHDLGPITHPDLFDDDVADIYRAIYAETAAIGPHMIFVSEASRAAYADLYPAAHPASTRIIYPAVRTDIEAARAEPVPGLSGPFLLTVGSIGARKNQLGTIAGFAQSGLASRGLQYVICGGREPGFDAVRAAAGRTPGVIHLPYVSDAQLSWLYGHASGFVLLSLLEGFGMPVIEAIARGLVPLVSRDSVLHEVAGDGALLADPLDPAEIAIRMEELIELPPAERERRMHLLGRSIDRFAIDGIRDRWRAAIRDMLATA